jgi:hypothetical protein
MIVFEEKNKIKAVVCLKAFEVKMKKLKIACHPIIFLFVLFARTAFCHAECNFEFLKKQSNKNVVLTGNQYKTLYECAKTTLLSHLTNEGEKYKA